MCLDSQRSIDQTSMKNVETPGRARCQARCPRYKRKRLVFRVFQQPQPWLPAGTLLIVIYVLLFALPTPRSILLFQVLSKQSVCQGLRNLRSRQTNESNQLEYLQTTKNNLQICKNGTASTIAAGSPNTRTIEYGMFIAQCLCRRNHPCLKSELVQHHG